MLLLLLLLKRFFLCCRCRLKKELSNVRCSVRWNTPLGATGAANAGAGVGAGDEAGPGRGAGRAEGPSPLITVHSPTKLYFR
jgi:hypothetical protein